MDRFKLSLVATVLLCAAKAFAGSHPSPALDVKTCQVIIFKDGYCMFVKEATGKTDASGTAHIQGIPEAMVLGSFWAIPETGKLTSVVAKQDVVRTHGRQEAEKSLLVQFDPGDAGRDVKLTLLHFGPGIRWIPTYRIGLGDHDKAHLIMQAEILNEAEDLSDVQVNLVVGVPNFRFKNVVSPISLEATLRNALQQAAPQLMGQTMSNVLFSQRAGERRGGPQAERTSSGPGVPALPPELAGEGSQDLFVYRIPELSLGAGERAAIPLVSADVPLRHLHTWDVRLSRSGTEAVPGGGARTSPVRLLKNEVWHLVELTNETNVPWTTGAALTMDGYLPLGQDLLTYTSVGGKCQVPLTVAMDVRGTYSEEETGRDLKALHFDRNDYVRISKKGTLRVTNYKEESISLIITCEFGGNATKASDEGKITVSDFNEEDWREFRGHRALTGHTTIQWDLELTAGETKEVTCEYVYYTR